jgi:transcriptional regulator with XRE-family HTH domain
MNYAKTIAKHRAARGWTQKELARRLDLSVMAVSAWEQGLKRPSFTARVGLAEILGIPQSQILPEYDQAESMTCQVTESELINLVEACRRIPVERRSKLLGALQILAEEYATPAAAADLPEAVPALQR